MVQKPGQRVAVDLAAQVLVELRVSHRQRGLAGDRLEERDVAGRPARRRALIGDLDQPDRAPVDHQRHLDRRPPAAALHELAGLLGEGGIGQ